MRIREIVEKLEKIEKCTDGEALELTTSLIDELIQFDLKMNKFFQNVNMLSLIHI